VWQVSAAVQQYQTADQELHAWVWNLLLKLSLHQVQHIAALLFSLKKIPVFRATRPYLSEPANPRLLFMKILGFFRWGLYN